MMEKINSVIFDWGGVLIDDPAPALRRYCAKALGVSTPVYTQVYLKFHADFQKGIISEDVFWQNVCAELKVPKPAIRSLWGRAFAAVYSPRPDMFELVSSLKNSGYKTAILSNTELPAMQYFYQQRYDMFEASVFSCAEGMLKPEKEIYELTLKRLGVQPRQALFIDDKQLNTDAADKIGLNTILFKSTGQVRDKLALLAVKPD
jgi:putative hydrolase of the HAD superfamily